MGSGAAISAEVIPEVGEEISGLPLPPRLESEQARFRLFDAVTTFLKRAADARPTVLILEDLQWSDTPLFLLDFFSAGLLDTPLVNVPGLQGATQLVTETLALVPANLPESGRLLSRLGLLLNLDKGDYQQATEVFNRALSIARKEGNTALEMRTEAAAAEANFYHLNWVAALEISERVITLAQRRNDPQSEA